MSGETSPTDRAPIFVVGASRSGTNLVRAILNKHSEVWVSGETHYFDDLRPRLNGDATRPLVGRERNQVERYFLALSHRPYGWDGDPGESSIDASELRALASARTGSADAYFEAFCTLRARLHGKSHWAEKTPRHVYRIDDILSAFPDGKIVCLLRDPRAVVASYRDWHKLSRRQPRADLAVAHAADRQRAKRSYNIVLMSLLWRSVVRSTYGALRCHGAERVRVQRFEQLALRPEQGVSELCAWLGLQYEPQMLEIPLVKSSYSAVDEPKGISAEPADRWRSMLSPAEVAIVQRCCGRIMDELDYAREPVDLSAMRLAWAWASLAPSSVRAAFANRRRLGRTLDYVRRRAAPALSRRELHAHGGVGGQPEPARPEPPR
jgi:hypothetical protein